MDSQDEDIICYDIVLEANSVYNYIIIIVTVKCTFYDSMAVCNASGCIILFQGKNYPIFIA